METIDFVVDLFVVGCDCTTFVLLVFVRGWVR